MTPQKPPLSFFQKHKKHLLSVLLSGTILATGAGGLLNKDALASADFDASVNQQISLSGGKYSQEQAELRVLGAQKIIKANYPGRSDEGVLKRAFEKCAQTDYSADQVPEDSRELWKNMQFLKDSQTVIGTPLAAFSTQADIFYCYKAELESFLGGVYEGSNGVVSINPSQKNSELWHILPHETIHAIQRANNILTEVGNPEWAASYFQTHTLLIEAAAMTGEFLLALELSQKGNKKENEELYKGTLERNAQYVAVYEEELKKGSSHSEALSFVGEARFWGLMKEQWWLDFYNDLVLKQHVTNLLYGSLKAPSGEVYPLDKAKMVGYISPEFNFTAKLDHLPSAKERFGSNIRMQQAFDYVESQRLAKALGEKSPVYKKELARLKKEKNPYVGINLLAAWAATFPFGEAGMVRAPLEAMDYEAASLHKKKEPISLRNNKV